MTSLSDARSQLRTSDGKSPFERELEKLAKGVQSAFKSRSILTEIETFRTADGFPPDAVHDVLEGVVPYTVSQVLTDICLKKKVVGLEVINNIINRFQYSRVDRRDKPLPLKVVGSRVKVKQKASQMWTLIRFLPIMLAEIMPCTPEWKLVIRLARMVEYIFALSIDQCDLHVLQVMIETWLKDFLGIFPGYKLKPKFHFMLHYADQIRLHGPMRAFWTLRFEQKHQILKHMSKNCMSRINVARTMAVRHEQHMALQRTTGQYTSETTEVGKGSDGAVKELKVRGVNYQIGDVIILRKGEDRKYFGLIEKFSERGSITVEETDIIKFDGKRNAFMITGSGQKHIIQLKDMADPFPLGIYNGFIVLHHFVDGITGGYS